MFYDSKLKCNNVDATGGSEGNNFIANNLWPYVVVKNPGFF